MVMLLALSSIVMPAMIAAPQVRTMSGTVTIRNERLGLPRDGRLVIRVESDSRSGSIFGSNSSSWESRRDYRDVANSLAYYSVRLPRSNRFNYSFTLPDLSDLRQQMVTVIAHVEADNRIVYHTQTRVRGSNLGDVDLDLRRYSGNSGSVWGGSRDDSSPNWESRVNRELYGEWRLVSIDGRSVRTSSSSTPTLNFRSDGSLAGHGGINRFSTEVRFMGSDGIRIQPGAMTKMGGSREAMELEGDFVAKLSDATRYRLWSDRLDLYRGNSILLSFRRR